MRKMMLALLMAAATTALAFEPAQQLDFKFLDKIGEKATSKVEIGMSGAELKAAASLLSNKNSDEANALKGLEGMTGYFMRAYEFKKGGFKVSDLKPLTDQLKAPDWLRFLHVDEGDELVEMYFHQTNGKSDGVLMIAAESNELVVMNAMGVTDLSAMEKLKSLPAIPNITLPSPGTK
jgi:hypothetical protein